MEKKRKREAMQRNGGAKVRAGTSGRGKIEEGEAGRKISTYKIPILNTTVQSILCAQLLPTLLNHRELYEKGQKVIADI